MSIWRGIQSAIFYYVSCAPCADASTRKQRKRQAVHDEQLRTELEAAHPDYPSQAAPGSVNPNWQIEIESGPRLPRKQLRALEGDINRTRSRDLNRVDSSGGPKALGRRDSKRDLKPSATQSTTSSKAQSSMDIYNTQRHLMVYQRPDEELWGTPSTSTVNLPTRPGTARTKSSTTPHLYHQKQHPAVNDLHPPTTRKVTSREEVAWMLQPLPSAAVMTGKEEPHRARSRTNSDVSRKSPKSSKSIPAPLTPIEAYHPSEETIIIPPTQKRSSPNRNSGSGRRLRETSRRGGVWNGDRSPLDSKVSFFGSHDTIFISFHHFWFNKRSEHGVLPDIGWIWRAHSQALTAS